MQARLLPRAPWIYFSIFCLLSVVGFAVLQYQVGQHLIRTLSEQSTLETRSSNIHYSLLSGELVVERVDITIAQAVAIQAEEMRFQAHWFSPWEQDFTFNEIAFENPEITIDSGVLASADGRQSYKQFLNSGLSLLFGEGYLAAKGDGFGPSGSLETGFEQLELKPDDDGEISIVAQGLSGEAEWIFSGHMNPTGSLLSGELWQESPLASIAVFFPGSCPDCEMLGEASSKFSISWAPSTGLELGGEISVAQGHFESRPGLDIAWDSLTIPGFRYQKNTTCIELVEVNGLVVNLGHTLQPGLQTLLTNPFVRLFQQLDFEDSRLVFQGAEEASFFSFSGRLRQQPNQSTRFELQGLWQDSIAATLNGTVSRNRVEYQLSSADVEIKQLPNSAREIAGYKLEGGRFDFNLRGFFNASGVTGQGQLIFDRLTAQPFVGATALDFSEVQSLLTDTQGKMRVPLKVEDVALGQLQPDITRSIEHYWETVVANPLSYFSEALLDGSELVPGLSAVPGLAQLSASSDEVLGLYGSLLQARPGLRLSIQGMASQGEDWPVLAKGELEKNLLELYSALRSGSKQPDSIPSEVRSQLLEQMYLRTRNRKQPEVGDETPTERIKRAEEWLVQNWPVMPEQLMALAKARGEEAQSLLLASGVDSFQVTLDEPEVGERNGSIRLQINPIPPQPRSD